MIQSSTLNFNPLDYEEVTFMRKKRKVRVPPYRALALFGTYKDSTYTIQSSTDFLTVLIGLGTNAQHTFLELHTCYCDDGISRVVSGGKTQTQKNQFSLGYKELNTAGLVKRVKRQQYIINPRMYINFEYYEDLCTLWDSI